MNPTRLFVCNLPQGVKKTELKDLFPTAVRVCIPQRRSKKKGSAYGFLQFSSPVEAKAAFDDSQDMIVKNQKISVLFAKRSELKQELKKMKGEKRNVEVDKEEINKVGNDTDDKEELKKVGNDTDDKEEVNTMEAPAMTRIEKRKAKRQKMRLKKNKVQKTINEVYQSKEDIDNDKVIALENWDAKAHTHDDMAFDEGKTFGDSVAAKLEVDDHDEVTRKDAESEEKNVDERNVDGSGENDIKSEELGSQFMEGEGFKVLDGVDAKKKLDVMIDVDESKSEVDMYSVRQEDVMTRSEVAVDSGDQIDDSKVKGDADLDSVKQEGERNIEEEEKSTRADLESIMEEIQAKVEEQQRKLAEERLKIMDKRIKMENERWKLMKREEKSKKSRR